MPVGFGATEGEPPPLYFPASPPPPLRFGCAAAAPGARSLSAAPRGKAGNGVQRFPRRRARWKRRPGRDSARWGAVRDGAGGRGAGSRGEGGGAVWAHSLPRPPGRGGTVAAGRALGRRSGGSAAGWGRGGRGGRPGGGGGGDDGLRDAAALPGALPLAQPPHLHGAQRPGPAGHRPQRLPRPQPGPRRAPAAGRRGGGGGHRARRTPAPRRAAGPGRRLLPALRQSLRLGEPWAGGGGGACGAGRAGGWRLSPAERSGAAGPAACDGAGGGRRGLCRHLTAAGAGGGGGEGRIKRGSPGELGEERRRGGEVGAGAGGAPLPGPQPLPFLPWPGR